MGNSQVAKALRGAIERHCLDTGDLRADVAGLWAMSPGHLSNILHGVASVPAQMIIRCARDLHDPTPIHALCHLCGGSFRPDPEGANVPAEIGGALKSIGAWVQDAAGALDHGKVALDELHDLTAEFIEMLRRLHATQSELEGLAVTTEGRCSTLAGAEADETGRPVNHPRAAS